ncbi:TlpA disulfide reductase family protein [Pedobacter sp. L105]|uniref:TlpA disulfide reductase family protein n=1 Tax=Pedobacter sp. L105 TaxID=1641871 RepID=UPI00131D90EE|nr:TlpA disulfide reductase family protein [Pedobacter sp. L105]
MKKIFLVFAAMTPLLAAAQAPNFTISGKIGHLDKPAKVYIDYTSEGSGRVDSAEVVNGTFQFSGYISGTAYSRMTLSHDGAGKNQEIYVNGAGDVIYFFFGKENIQINSADSLYNAKFSGSKVYDEMLAFDQEAGETVMKINRTANLEIQKGTEEQQKDPAFIKSIDVVVKRKNAERKAGLLKFAKNHPDSYFSVQALTEALGGYRVPVSEVEPIFNTLNEGLRTSYAGISLSKLLNAGSITGIGAKAPGFTQNDANGKPVSLSDLRGKYVLLEFWASWCHPCRAESPNLLKQYQLYKNKGFEILSVSVDSDKSRWLEAIAKDGLTWIQVSDLKGWDNEARKLYGLNGVPGNFLISPEGKIVASNLIGEKLNKKLAELLATQ